MTSRTIVFAVLVAACNPDDNNSAVDAPPRPDAAPSCPPRSAPLNPGMHKLYLSFSGVTLAFGACDDSRANCTSLVSQASTVVPTFLQGSAPTRVTAIAASVQEVLAPFSIDVVTTRPSSGNYWMVSIGGTTALVSDASNPILAVKSVC